MKNYYEGFMKKAQDLAFTTDPDKAAGSKFQDYAAMADKLHQLHPNMATAVKNMPSALNSMSPSDIYKDGISGAVGASVPQVNSNLYRNIREDALWNARHGFETNSGDQYRAAMLGNLFGGMLRATPLLGEKLQQAADAGRLLSKAWAARPAKVRRAVDRWNEQARKLYEVGKRQNFGKPVTIDGKPIY